MFLSRPEADVTNLATWSLIKLSMSWIGLGRASGWAVGAAGGGGWVACLATPGSSGALDEAGRWVAPASETVPRGCSKLADEVAMSSRRDVAASSLVTGVSTTRAWSVWARSRRTA